MEVTIEELQPSEVHSFWPLYAEVLRTQFPGYTPSVILYFLNKIYTPESFIYWLTHHMKTIFTAKTGDTMVGFAVIDEPYGGVSFCRWLGIRQEFQRKGIGTKLIKRWIELAKLTQCHKVEVAAQPEARVFYKKAGLKEEGRRDLSYFGIDQYIFGLIIGKPDSAAMTRY